MPRSAAIIIQGEGLALIERRREGRTYYVFPGGGVEPGETPEQAAVREVREELGVEIAIERLVAEVLYMHVNQDRTRQYYYLARIISGAFGTGRGSEMLGLYPSQSGTYRPVWLPLAQLARETVYPVGVIELVGRAVRTGWPAEIAQIREAA